jgi:5'-3' exonuclease
VAAPLLAVDAPSLLYRAYHALPDSIEGPNGPVNALLGTTNMLLAMVLERRPRAVVLCSGPDAARYRTELYAPYHAHRPEVPPDLARQFEEAPAFFGAFDWTWADDDELEADDLLGSYARAEADAGGTALIVTGDRDLFQCATDDVTVLYVRTGVKGYEEVDPADVQRRYGVPPALVPDFIALRGDPSDGLPGAKGVGEKTAAELLRAHGSLEAALDAWPRVRPARVAGALRDQRDEVLMFKDIATLRRKVVELPRDAPTDFQNGARAARSAGMERLARRLDELDA